MIRRAPASRSARGAAEPREFHRVATISLHLVARLLGSALSYANYGYLLLGQVIEAKIKIRYEDYLQLRMKEKMPDVMFGLLDGQLAWRQHDGGHTDGPNWKYFTPRTDRMLKRTPAASRPADTQPPSSR